jgi:hypothetical protein
VQYTDSSLQSSSSFTPDPHKYAMLITCNAWDDTARWNNLSHVFTGLKEAYGFMDENIFVLSGDGNFDPLTMNLDLNGDDYDCDFDGPCTKEKITEIFEYLDTTMTEEDIFLFYATTHGDTTGVGQDTTSLRLNNFLPLFDYELAEMVDNLTCSQMIFSMDICNGGGMVDDLEGPHRIVQVPVPWGSLVWRGWTYFDFFTYGWATAVRGFHPGSLTEPWEQGDSIGKHPNLALVYPYWNMPDTMPDLVSFQGNGDGFIQFGEVFNYTKYLDSEADSLGIEYQNDGFRGDLPTLNGIEGRVDTTQSIIGSYLFGRKLTLSPGVTLSKGTTSLNFYLNDNTEILIQDSAKLDINGNYTDITGCSGESFVTVDGDLRQTRMDFTANPGALINIRFTNPDNEYELDHFTFNNAKVSGNCDSLSFEQSNFINSPIEFSGSELILSNSNELSNSPITFSNGDLIITDENEFTNSTIDISNPSSLASSCEISGHNTFDNSTTTQAKAVITIENYTNFLIDSNDIKYADNRGIELFYAGWDENGDLI